MLIDIGRRSYLLYLLLPHGLKMRLLTPASRGRLDAINRDFNAHRYSGEGARAYDRIHRYAEADQHEYPAQALVEEVWAARGYGRALELGAGSGYFTALIARRARSVVAVEPVEDLQRVIAERCRTAGLDNVEVRGVSATDLPAQLAPGSIDTAFVIQSLHHFHRRPEVFTALGRVVRPGGRLFLVEPHHNTRRVLRLLRKYVTTYRHPEFRADALNWATHDFLTKGEIYRLCRRGGFEEVEVAGFWMPYLRRLVPDARRRFALERRLGGVPGLRHLAMVLAVEARRSARPLDDA
jgi:ubiquinone/menaquinone biosynthesis C-methylase UbiE